jgi:hypothetical protein
MGRYKYYICFALQFGVLVSYAYQTLYIQIPFANIDICFDKQSKGFYILGLTKYRLRYLYFKFIDTEPKE